MLEGPAAELWLRSADSGAVVESNEELRLVAVLELAGLVTAATA